MTIKELDQKLKDANDMVLNWKSINGDINELYNAIYDAMEANREAIIEFLKGKE